MPLLKALRAALAWLGRQGTRALAASVFLGLALPQLAAYVKPYLGEAVFVLLLFSYLRTDPNAFLRYLRAPALTIIAALWVMVVVPLLFGLGYTYAGLREGMPALYTILILQIATTPITSSAAFAALMGLDVAFSLVTLIITNALSPMPSRPGVFHPEPLTDSGRDTLASSGSCHRAKAAAFRRELELLLLPVGSLPNVGDLPPSLHGHYPASSLLRSSPPLGGASVLSASRVRRLCLFPCHRHTGSQVPYESPNESHAS